MRNKIFIWMMVMIVLISVGLAIEDSNLIVRYSLDVNGTADNGSPSCSAVGNLPTTGAALIGDGGNSQDFDGTGDYYNCGDVANLEFGTQDFTMVTWIYDTAGAGSSSIANKGYYTLGQVNNWVWRNHNTIGLEFHVFDGQTGTGCSIASGSITKNQKAMVAVTRNSSGLYLWKNTSIVGSDSGCAGEEIGNNTASYFIGRDAFDVNNDFTGQVDEFCIWKGISLTAADLSNLYNSGNGTTCISVPVPATDTSISIDPIVFDPSVPDQDSLINGSSTLYTNGSNANIYFKWYLDNVFQYSVNITGLGNNSPIYSTLDCGSYGCVDGGVLNLTVYANYTTGNTTHIYNTVTIQNQGNLTIEAYEKISGARLNNFNISSPGINGTTAGQINLTVAVGNVSVIGTAAGYVNTVNVSPVLIVYDGLTGANMTGFYSANITFNISDFVSGETLYNYTVNVTSLNYTYSEGGVSIDKNLTMGLINGSYNLTVIKDNYVIYNGNFSVNGSGFVNVTLYPNPSSIQVYMYYEENGTLITGTSITLTVSGSITEDTYSSSTGFIYVENLTAGNYTLKFTGGNFSIRRYSVTVGTNTTQILNAYLIYNAEETIFTILDKDTGGVIQGAEISMLRSIGGSLVVVESRTSDVSGRALFNFLEGARYSFVITHPSYTSKSFVLDPILFNSYDVLLTKSTTQQDDTDYSLVSSPVISPTIYYNNQSHNFSFILVSPSGSLVSYGVNLSYPGGSVGAVGSNANGGGFDLVVNISGASLGDYVYLNYFYETSVYGRKNFTRSYSIITVGNLIGTLEGGKGNTYGLGDFELILIATGLTMFAAGAAALVAGATGATLAGLFVLGFFAYQQYIPLSAILISALVGVVLIMWRSSR